MLTRLAPTPSGFIHTGNIYNFLLNWLWARSNSGKVLLRIDDGDAERKRKEYVEDIFRVFDWLGLDWDIGPTGPDDFEKNWSQTCRTDLYNDVLNKLAEDKLVFACECSRKQQCHCIDKKLSLSHPGTAWKIKIEKDIIINFKDRLLGNVSIHPEEPFVVKKKDGFAAYQVFSLADDRHFAVTHICRGNDLLPSTAMQLYIDKQLDRPYFTACSFWHHALITNTKGNKLSKSAGASGSSIIHQVNKEELVASFAKWVGGDISKTSNLKDMVGCKEFLIGKIE